MLTWSPLYIISHIRRNFLIKIINGSSQILKCDSPKEYVNRKIQTFNKPSAGYIDTEVGYNDTLLVTLWHKCTEVDSECYQLLGSLIETFYLLKVELQFNQAAISHVKQQYKNL